MEGQSNIEAIVQRLHQRKTTTTTTIQYTKAREQIMENIMNWVEFEKIKIANEKGRTFIG